MKEDRGRERRQWRREEERKIVNIKYHAL